MTRGRWRSVAVVIAVIALTVGVNIAVTRHAATVVAGSGSGSEGGLRDGGAGYVPPPTSPELHVPAAGGVSLSGFVVDGAGLPVVGAEVSVEAEREGAKAGTGTGSGSGSGSSTSTSVAPVTTAEGRFAISGLAPGRYRLRVIGPGLLAAELRYVPVPSETTRVVVARQVAIEGRVVDGISPVVGAHVGLRGDAIGGAIEVTTDSTGGFRVANLPEGRYQVWAWQAALAARAVRVGRLGAGPFGAVELHLEPAAIVVGRVVDRDEGTGLIAAVELRPVGDDQAPRYARTGDDGVFRIEGVPTGRWIADAFAPGYTSPGGVELEAGKGVPELALAAGGTVEGRVVDGEGHPIEGAAVRALVGAAPGASGAAAVAGTEISEAVDLDRLRRYSGRTAAPESAANAVPGMAPGGDPVLLPRGELGVMLGPIPPLPPPGQQAARPATIDLSGGPGADLAGAPTPLHVDPDRASIWTTGPDGRYRIRGMPRGKLVVLAEAAGYAEARSRQVTLGTTPAGGAEVQTGVDIVLTAGTFVIGKVVDQHGVPVIGAQIAAQPELGAPAEGFTDAAGEYRIGPLSGAITLRATAYGHVDVQRMVELAPVRGTLAGEQREDLVLEVADATLAGTVEDDTGAPVASAQLEVIGGTGDGRHAIAATDGTFELDMLPAGALRIRLVHPDYPPEEVDAVATSGHEGARARLRLPLGGSVEGVLLDAASGAALASVSIVAAGPRGALAEATTDKAGRWKLGPLRAGAWRLAITLPGYLSATRALDVPTAHAPGGTTVRDVRIDLVRGALLGVTVRDNFGRRVPQAHVVARLSDGTGATAEGDTDASGELRLRDCPTGELELVATHGDARGGTHASVRPGDEILGLTIDMK